MPVKLPPTSPNPSQRNVYPRTGQAPNISYPVVGQQHSPRQPRVPGWGPTTSSMQTNIAGAFRGPAVGQVGWGPEPEATGATRTLQSEFGKLSPELRQGMQDMLRRKG
jgi:hypothetical protein